MSQLKIWHNARCSKSREALEQLQKMKKVNVEVYEYLKTPPTAEELKDVLKKLGYKAESLVRRGEDLYLDEYKDRKMTEAQWIKVLVANPILIERPIVVNGEKALIVRPPTDILDIL